MNFVQDFTKTDDGVVLARRQAIILTNYGWFTDAFMRQSTSTS